MTVNCAGLTSNQPLLRRSRQHRHRPQFDQPHVTVAQIAACKSISINITDENVDHRIISSQPTAEEKDDSLLNTTTFSEPDFGGDISDSKENTFTTTEAPSMPKTKSILRDTTNRVRNRRHRGEDKKDKVKNVQVDRYKQKAQNCVPIKTRVKQRQSEREASNETPVTFRQPEMTFFEDNEDYLDTTKFDGSFFNEGFDIEADEEMKSRRHLMTERETPVISNKSEGISVASTDEAVNKISFSEGERSFMTVSFSLDDSILSGVMPSDGEKRDEALFLCGLKDAVMLEIHCHSNVLNAVSYSFSEVKNYLVELPGKINAITQEPKNKSGRSKTGDSKERAKGELRSSKSLLI